MGIKKRARKQSLTTRPEPSWRFPGPSGPTPPKRTVGARVTIAEIELIDTAAAFAKVLRGDIVAEGAVARAREIIAHHMRLVATYKQRAARRAANLEGV